MTKPLSCAWAPLDDELYRSYHDTEWGVPEYDSRALWEKLQLDGMQAGLAWITILRKRDSIRNEFDGFDPESIACWNEQRIDKAMMNAGIIRSRQKIHAVIGNAKTYLAMAEQGEDFSSYCWKWVGGEPTVNKKWKNYGDMPTKTSVSESISKDLKTRGFKYVGPTIVHAWMQAVGLVNDHELGCPRHAAVQKLARE